MENKRYGASDTHFSVALSTKEKKAYFRLLYHYSNFINLLALAIALFFLWNGYCVLNDVTAYANATLTNHTAISTDDANDDDSVVSVDSNVREGSAVPTFTEVSEVSMSIGESDIKVTANNLIIIAVIYFAVALLMIVVAVKNCKVSAEST